MPRSRVGRHPIDRGSASTGGASSVISTLDFGQGPSHGIRLWLQIAERSFLSPHQRLTTALFALRGDNAGAAWPDAAFLAKRSDKRKAGELHVRIGSQVRPSI